MAFNVTLEFVQADVPSDVKSKVCAAVIVPPKVVFKPAVDIIHGDVPPDAVTLNVSASNLSGSYAFSAAFIDIIIVPLPAD